MQWIIDTLLGIDRVAMGKGDWSIFWRNPPLTWLLILVIIPGVLVLTYYFYHKEHTPIPLPVRIFLVMLRCILIFLLLVIIFEPVLLVETVLERQSNLVIMMDESLSMSFDSKFTDAGERAKLGSLMGLYAKGEKPTPEKEAILDKISRLDLVSKVLTNTYPSILGKLDEKYKIKFYTFSNQLTNRELADITKVDPVGKGTSIGDSMTSLVNILSAEPLAGVVLISDGQNNLGSDPLNAVQSLVEHGNMAPVWTIAAGSTQESKDIEVLKLQALPVAVAKDFVEFKFTVRSSGFDNETVTAYLKEDKNVVAEEKITLTGKGREQEIVLKYKPMEPGEHLCQVNVPFQKGEIVEENNTVSHHLRIIDEKIKVLYIETYPRWEYRAIKNALIRDHTIKASCWLIDSDPEFVQESSPGVEPLKQLSLDKKDLFNYDVIILGDVSPRHLADPTTTGSAFTDWTKVMENMTTFVSDMGGGIAFVSGTRFNPRSFKDTPFAELLPIVLDEDYSLGTGDSTFIDSFRPRLTPKGKDSMITRLLPDNAANMELWSDDDKKGDGLAEFWWFCPVKQSKPGAEVLAEHPTLKNKYGPYPIFVTQWYGSGRVFFSATDETWRWRSFIGDKYFYSFWGEVIRDLRGGRLMGSKRYNIKVDKASYALGDKIIISARIYNEDFKPLEEPTFNAHLELSTGLKQDIELKLAPNSRGTYEGTIKATDTGNHWIWAGPAGIGEEKERSYTSFLVTLPMREFEKSAINTFVLEQIAQKTNGAFVQLYDIENLPKLIKPTGKIVLTEAKEDDLWDSPLFFLLFIFAITAEWVIRKLVRLL
ncbi:MAG: hypothetical protein HY811_11115 [Planctomycetes bacterium]|nr:hypothetical protein [Planctomycetota bacterium]